MSIVLAGFVLSFEPISRQEKASALSSSRGGKTWKTVELVREGKLSGREKIFPPLVTSFTRVNALLFVLTARVISNSAVPL